MTERRVVLEEAAVREWDNAAYIRLQQALLSPRADIWYRFKDGRTFPVRGVRLDRETGVLTVVVGPPEQGR